ncbi:MAG: hypothetical protein AAGG68_04155 [Bacteroidota bacterium]
MRATFLLITFLFSGIVLFGQTDVPEEDYTIKDNQASLKRIWKKAKKDHKAGDYDSALGLYGLLAEQDTNSILYMYEMASLADTLGALVTAEKYFARATEHEDRSKYPALDYRYGKVLQNLGKYDQAIKYYQRFRRERDSPDEVDAGLLNMSKELENDCKEAKRIIREKPSLYSNIKSLDDPVNDLSGETSDFAPYQDNGQLYFSRLQYTDAKKENRKLKSYKHRPKESGLDRVVNSDDQNAYLTLSSDGQHLYEIGCTKLNARLGERDCKIYRRDFAKGAWSRRKALPNTINLAEYTNTQPSIGVDEAGNDVLFFTSNRPGGSGGMDIWSAIIIKDADGYLSYEDPINVRQINTVDDEISPYYHSKCNTLYFSSDRKPSVGGFDIYQATYNGRGYERVKSLGYPINSSFDDVDFFRSGTGDKAFFASKRLPPEGQNTEVKGCCLDIYEADLEMPVDLNLAVYCGTDRISGADYTMESMRSKGATVAAVDTSGKLDVPIRLKPNEEYLFSISKADYTAARFDLMTNEVCEPTELFERVYIRPLKNLTIEIQGQGIRETVALDSVSIVVKDAESEYFIDEAENSATSKVEFSVDPGKTYIVEINREGYEGDTITVVVPKIDESCFTATTVVLNPEIPNLPLPAEIYFHNAIPSIQTYSYLGRTNVSYKTTYLSYMELIPLYKNRLKNYYETIGEINAADAAAARVDEFFDSKVKVGYEKLDLYANAMIKYLQRGNTITVQMRGTASPLASASYNKFLSERRVNSVKNYLRNFKNGILAPYIDNGQLKINPLPLGEPLLDTVTKSQMENDYDFGVYDPESAVFRRVVIERIDTDESN